VRSYCQLMQSGCMHDARMWWSETLLNVCQQKDVASWTELLSGRERERRWLLFGLWINFTDTCVVSISFWKVVKAIGVFTDIAFHESQDHEVEPVPTTLSLHSPIQWQWQCYCWLPKQVKGIRPRIASAVLPTGIPSVCPSVCQTPVLCQNDGT